MKNLRKIFIFLLILKLFAESLVKVDRLVGFIEQEPITMSDLKKVGLEDKDLSLLKLALKRKGLTVSHEEITFLANLAANQDPRFPRLRFEDLEITANFLKIFGPEISKELSDTKVEQLAYYLLPSPSPEDRYSISLVKWVGDKSVMGNFYAGDRSMFTKEHLPPVKEKELQDIVWEAVGGLPEGYLSVPFIAIDGSITIFEVAKRTRKLTLDENSKEMARAILAAELLSKKFDFYRQRAEELLKVQVTGNF